MREAKKKAKDEKPKAATAHHTNTPAVGAPTAVAPANSGGGNSRTFVEPKKNNVIQLPGMCMAEGCKQKSEKASFCMEHFDWFKEGLITKEGRKPTDFEKKYFDYQRRVASHRKAA